MQQEPGAVAALRRVTGHAGSMPGQGPFIRVTLGADHAVIRDASYETYQCPGCVACGKAICDLATGKGLTDARSLKHADLLAKVGPLPRHRQICYGLALLALQDALGKLGV